MVIPVSVCMIVRDEAESLARCFESLRPWVEDWVVIDTGSVDNSLSIAERYDARVEQMTWPADFSVARNRSLELARCPWILVMDADEEFDPASLDDLRQSIDNPMASAYTVQVENRLSSGRSAWVALPRLFRNDPQIRFSRPVHESVVPALRRAGLALTPSGVRLIHHGYLPEAIEAKQKYRRNQQLLRTHLEREPEDLYSQYKLAITLKEAHQRMERKKCFAQALDLAHRIPAAQSQEYPFLPQLFRQAALAQLEDQNLMGFRRTVRLGLARFPQHPDLLLEDADRCRREGDRDRAWRRLRDATLAAPPSLLEASDEGRRRRRIQLLRTRMHLEDKDFAAARRAIGELDPGARDDEERCLRAEISLQEGAVDAAWTELRNAAEPRRPDVSLLRGRCQWDGGQHQEAVRTWSRISGSNEAAQEARCRLAIEALARGSQRDAQACLAGIGEVHYRIRAARLMVSQLAGTHSAGPELFAPVALRDAIHDWLKDWTDAAGDTAYRELKRRGIIPRMPAQVSR